MKKVAYISLADDGSSYYRCQGVLPFINHPELQLTDISDKNIHSWAPIADADIVFFQRPFLKEHADILLQAKMMGKRVIIDFDDDVLNVPEHNPAFNLYKQNKNHALQCLRLADEIWVSTLAIYNEFVKYNKNIFIIPNAHNDYLFPVGKKQDFNGENKTVVYRGADTHRIDLYTHTTQLVKAAKDNPDWEFVYIGPINNHEFYRANEPNPNVTITNKLPFIQYVHYLHQLNAAVMICPLEDTPLNRAKSNCSWLEGTYAGSAFFGNKNLPEFKMSYLIDFDNLNKELCVSEGLENLLSSHNNSSWSYIKENLLLSKINQERIERLLA